MNTRKNLLKEASVLFISVILISTVIFLFTPITQSAKAEQIGQIKIKEGFEIWPPAGWWLSGPALIVQTTGEPGGECQIGHHAAKIYFTGYTIGYRFFGEMGTPIFNGKKGGGNILTFWYKQLILNNNLDQLVVLVFNGLGGWIQVANYTSSMDWTYEKINLNDFIHPTKTMQVVFIAILHGGSNVYIDEVIITGISGE